VEVEVEAEAGVDVRSCRQGDGCGQRFLAPPTDGGGEGGRVGGGWWWWWWVEGVREFLDFLETVAGVVRHHPVPTETSVVFVTRVACRGVSVSFLALRRHGKTKKAGIRFDTSAVIR